MDDDVDAWIAAENRAASNPRISETAVVATVGPLTVNRTGIREQAVAAIGVTPAVGDIVLIARPAGVLPIVVARIATGGTEPTPPEAMPTTGSELVAAAFSWSWKDGQPFTYEQTVRQGALDSSGSWTGAWFHQNEIPARLAGATITSLQVRLTRAPGGSAGTQPVSLYLASTATWPTPGSTPPAATSSAVNVPVAVGETRWVTLPAGWGQAMVDSGAGLMITAPAAPMVILAGLGEAPESGLLRLDWSR